MSIEKIAAYITILGLLACVARKLRPVFMRWLISFIKHIKEELDKAEVAEKQTGEGQASKKPACKDQANKSKFHVLIHFIRRDKISSTRK